MITQVSALLLVGALVIVASPTPHAKRTDPKAVFAHVIVRNTCNYTPDKWSLDIALACSKAIDVFTMNVGRHSWQPGQVKAAYNAATTAAPNFKRFVSLDLASLASLASLACGSVADGQYIINNFITPFKSHPNRYLFNSKMFLSTFGGQDCTFGQASPLAGWQWLISQAGTPIYFILNLQMGDATTLNTTWNFIDGYSKFV
ncbi:hypothetical protein BDV93DRAFT_559076 [Ceratobasidium sp. AG-I]|nr:hypothetical protein BDV93DRAFT_559076 [Ceratobasidium sp. AG-I]